MHDARREQVEDGCRLARREPFFAVACVNELPSSPLAAAARAMIDVGTRFSGYEIVEELAKGGMATLFLAQRVGAGGFNRHVAVKVVSERFAEDKRFVEMFFDEARLCAFIDHPNVIHVESLGAHEGQHYLVMEYLPGVTIRDILAGLARRREQLDIPMAVSLAAQIADGLHGAHETTDEHGYPLNVIHRDVSPHNVIVTSAGHVKVIDFGVAKARGRLQSTEAGLVRGKLAYMSPEQLAGRDIDRRTDVFAAAVVLWEALTLRRLFRGRTDVETMQNVREMTIPAPSTLRDGISPELDAVVLSALSRNPEGRPATARILRRALNEAAPAARFVDPEAVVTLVQTTASEALAARVSVDVDKTVVGAATDSMRAEAAATSQPWSPKERPSEDLPRLARAEAQARLGDDPVALASAIGSHAVALIYAGEYGPAEERIEEAAHLVQTRALGLRPSLVSWRAQLAAARGDFGARLDAYREAVEVNEEAGRPRKAAIATLNLADCHNQAGDYESAERDLVLAIARMRQLGYRNIEGYGQLNLALARGMLGRRDEALEGLALAETIAGEFGDSRLRLFAGVYRGKILLHCGAIMEGVEAAEVAAEQGQQLEVPGVSILGSVVAARGRLALGEPDRALELAQRAHREWQANRGVEEGEAELFLTLAAAYEAHGELIAAARVREEGRASLLRTAAKIASAPIRERYLALPSRAALLSAR